MDLTLFWYFNGWAGHGALWDDVIVFIASDLQYVLGALLVVLVFWPIRPASPKTMSRGGHIRMFGAAFAAAIFARLVVKPLILLFVHRARPFITLDGVRNLIGTDPGENLQSFPSGHAIFFFALATAVYRYDKRWGCIFFAGALLMGAARIIGGVHWPSDILGGALIGMLIGWLMIQFIPPFPRASSS